MADSSSLVCEVCLYQDPTRVELLTFKCFHQIEHRHYGQVPVIYSRQLKKLVKMEQQYIRPLPRLRLEPNKKYILCRHADSCVKGDSCTFAHSREEQEAWNTQLLEQDRSLKIGSFIKFPRESPEEFTLHDSHFPVLSPASPFTPRSTPFSPPGGQFSFAQAAMQKNSRDHVNSRHNSYPTSHNTGGFNSYQRSRTTYQPTQVKGRQGTRTQPRSVSESSADTHHVSHYGATGSDRTARSGVPQQANMAGQEQVNTPGPQTGLPNRRRSYEQPQQYHQAERHYGHAHPRVTTPIQPRPPPVPYGAMPHPQVLPAYHHPNMPVQFPFSPPVVPPVHSPSHYPPPPPRAMGVVEQVDEWPMMVPTPPQPRPLFPSPRPNPIPSTRAPVPSQPPRPAHTGGGGASNVKGADTSEDLCQAKLSRENYKSKFKSLLDIEEGEHKRVLDEKCNGQYTLVLYQYGAKPANVRWPPEDKRYRRYGYLDGISGDQVAYATQASQGMIHILALTQAKKICEADILRDNYTHIDEKLYIAFNMYEDQKLQGGFREACFRGKVQFSLNVQFILKHTYFRNLRSCVDRISPVVVKKIVPSPGTFRVLPKSDIIDLNPYKDLCSPDQLEALKAILTCPSEGPPNVIVGPFGTGKTRLLSIAASCYFTEARNRGQPARILVCTQQRESVDNFYDHFQQLMGKKEVDVEVIILRDYGFRHVDTEEKNVYKTIQNFLQYRKFLNVQQNHLIISTCMMVRELVRDLGNEFFTHILIDEGAQMREPEAIAPLSLAHPIKTKIVIAGDQHQVGPAMLVFGEVPLTCGLGTSLLERLYSSYKRLRQESYISTLVTNYRSHPKIFELPSALFYETPLIAPQDREPPPLHQNYPYPLVFICSSLDENLRQVDDNINEVEASILLEEANRLARNWPNAQWGPQDLSQACIMSPCRPQLTKTNQLIYEKKLSGRLRAMRRLPTYDMQGREFRALFLSTSEPTNPDASTRNPTKSLCDRHVFNTAITRAQSLVVAVGNPFLLLKTEETMLSRYGKKGKVWSNYLKRCIENKSFKVPDSLKFKPNKKAALVSRLKELVDERVADPEGDTPTQEVSAEVYGGDDEFPPLAPPPSQRPLGRAPLTPSAAPQVRGQSVTTAQQSHDGHHGYQPLQQQPLPATQQSYDGNHGYQPLQQQQQLPAAQQSHDGHHGYQPLQQQQQQLPAAQPVISSTGVTSNVPDGSQGQQWSFSNLESLLNFELPPSEGTTDLFQQFPALQLAVQSSGSTVQPPASYPTQEPVGVAQQGYQAQPMTTGHAQHPLPPQAGGIHQAYTQPQPVTTGHAQAQSQTDYGQTQFQTSYNQAQFQTDYSQAQSQVTPGYTQDQVQSQVLQTVNPHPVHTHPPQPVSNVPAPMALGHHGNPAEATSPLTDNVFSPVEQQPGHGGMQMGSKVTSYPDTDVEVEEVLTKRKVRTSVDFQTDSSAVWTGGEMRVSPELSSSHNIGHGASIPVYSDDTHRRTPSPLSEADSPPRKKGGATAMSATPTTTTRLEKDFEVKEQIGKGGFGVVFHVRDKLDQYEYALKLIRLSNVPKEQDKVMREVRALAQLEHRHIVRYHTSWKERAPDGWTERRVWSILKSSGSLPSAMGPVAGDGDSTHTTPRATAPSSALTSAATSDVTVEGVAPEDSVVTFRDSDAAGSVHQPQPQPHRRDHKLRDTDLLNAVRQPHPLDHTPPPTCLFIQTELCKRDTLRVWLIKNCGEKQRIKKVVLDYFHQVLEALVYIHRERFVHRDLKPSNIFFSRREDQLKIGDFGLVTTGVVLPHGGVDSSRVGSADSHSRGSVQAGTFLYMSPEQINGEKCDEKSDMFALGLIFFELHYCMKTDAQRYQVLTALRSRLEFPSQFIERLPNEASSIVRSLLSQEPDKRPRAVDLKEQKSLKNLDKKVRKSKKEHIPVF